MIPRYPGLKVIKPVTIRYFDPSRREYVRLRSPQIELNVEQGARLSSARDVRRGRARTCGCSARTSGSSRWVRRRSCARASCLYAQSAASSFCCCCRLRGLAGAFVYARQRQVVMLDQAGYRNRRAMKVAQKGLHEAEYLLKEKSARKDEPVVEPTAPVLCGGVAGALEVSRRQAEHPAGGVLRGRRASRSSASAVRRKDCCAVKRACWRPAIWRGSRPRAWSCRRCRGPMTRPGG